MLLTNNAALVLLIALALDAIVGDPNWIWRRLPHPVALMGRAIFACDRRFNRDQDGDRHRRLAGFATVIGLLAIAIAMGLALGWLVSRHPALHALEVIAVATLLAQRSLYEHVDRVRRSFATGGLTCARKAVASIVGRNPETLDEAGVCRASIESAAENFSDGVVAPALWYLVAGLPGIFAYKMLNTADSMIGHRSQRHAAFGWAAARLDDIANLLPARLAALLIAISASAYRDSARAALRGMLQDARRHRSPNAGWPEAAMAGSLGLALAGPRVYGKQTIDDAWMNPAGRKDATPNDIARALRVFVRACAALAGLVAALWMVHIAT